MCATPFSLPQETILLPFTALSLTFLCCFQFPRLDNFFLSNFSTLFCLAPIAIPGIPSLFDVLQHYRLLADALVRPFECRDCNERGKALQFET
eukprot:m.23854 g.23854  ORF g.23854 m.23854 type:complete len:93 (+) comp4177_c0_seq1:3250-3528(+)